MGDAEVAATGLAVAAAAASALVWWMTREAAAGRIPRNRSLGIRTRRTLASDEGWVLGHEVALPWTRYGRYAAGVVAVAALVAVGADRAVPLGIALGLAGMAVVLASCLGAVLAINRALPD
ncbi:SdpI family protein [Nocardioides sp. Soil805]|uniref:SdpI family protein n=1 Tax=Nocardioides sp. Soil805 TaxID=1736416 RepID=UPI000702D96D|nr:SdpI family protein [Nocardioides sp. Soil805]KRF34352.1 hypothetical protein ASG94_16770 [Nocardioides sp. Soil805]